MLKVPEPTRWNSTWFMLESLVKSEESILMIQEQFVDRESQLSRADFVQLAELLVALDPFTAASALMEGDLETA